MRLDGRDRGSLRPPSLSRAALGGRAALARARRGVAREALAARYVDGDTVPPAVTAERYQRFPRTSFVYSVVR